MIDCLGHIDETIQISQKGKKLWFCVKYDRVLDGIVHPKYEMKRKMTRKALEHGTTKT